MNTYYCTHNADGTEHPDTCVWNPLDCDWDVDDSTQWQGYGTVNTGETYSKTFCVVADGYDNNGGDEHRVQAKVFAATSSLTVSFKNDQGVTYTKAPIQSGKNWLWLFCERDLTGLGQPIDYYPVVPNSNGGTGIQVYYTVSVTVGPGVKGKALEIDTNSGNSGPYTLGC